jgi:signal transduction histidine kinase/FixJ family two-component response regulator
MIRPSNLMLIAGGLLLALTYLLVQGATPDAARHERMFEALRELTLNEAALQRDVLKARAGLLRNYDPLVASVENLRRAVETLRSDSQIAGSGMATEIALGVQGVATAVADQEALVEAFKSRNALLHNSLTFLSHTARQFDGAGGGRQSALSTEVGALANAMLRFTSDPQVESSDDVMASLNRLAQLPIEESNPALRSLVAHGRLIVATLPAVDNRVGRVLASATTARTQALQNVYLEAHARAVMRAGIFRILLYIASLALLAYVGYLFVRLRAHARILRSRLAFERLISAISAQFINLPHDRLDDGINDGLKRLATHTGIDRAHIVVCGSDAAAARQSYEWQRPEVAAPTWSPQALLELATHPAFESYQNQRCMHVPDVAALADSEAKLRLREHGVRSWLCIPIWSGDRLVGYLTLDAVSGRKLWLPDDVALSRTAGEIFANAIERERSDSEREKLEARLYQAERLESIGTLAGGIAHEFNNILSAIFGYAELALADLGIGSRAERHVQGIVTAGKRAQNVIEKILTFSRRSERRASLVAAEPVVAEAVELLRASLPTTVALEVALAAGDAAVLADATELQQVVMNFCTNGAQAMGNAGTLSVRLDVVEADAALALSHGGLPAGRYVRLSVQDTGSGIDPADLERIVEPFFTTKAVGQGTGLGLSTVHGIVTQHGGALNVESRLGHGSTFQAYFPHAGAALGEPQAARAPALRRGRGETILIVDDDAPLVPLAEETLAALGYEPVGFDQSTAALAAFRAAPDRFDLVLTDDIMPGMTGTELAAQLHALRPGLPIILMTGAGAPTRANTLRAAGVREVVRKPLLAATMAELLARHLPAPAPAADVAANAGSARVEPTASQAERATSGTAVHERALRSR